VAVEEAVVSTVNQSAAAAARVDLELTLLFLFLVVLDIQLPLEVLVLEVRQQTHMLVVADQILFFQQLRQPEAEAAVVIPPGQGEMVVLVAVETPLQRMLVELVTLHQHLHLKVIMVVLVLGQRRIMVLAAAAAQMQQAQQVLEPLVVLAAMERPVQLQACR